MQHNSNDMWEYVSEWLNTVAESERGSAASRHGTEAGDEHRENANALRRVRKIVDQMLERRYHRDAKRLTRY